MKIQGEIGAPSGAVELRSVDGGGTILFGYAARFNSPSSPIGGSFVETIAPGAFDDVMGDDVVALFDHDTRRLLGRTGAGLTLAIDDVGLRYEVELDMEDPDAVAVQRKLARGVITGSSFMFSVAESGDKWDRDGDIRTRTIIKIGRLYDVGPVTFPAYPASSAALRSLQAFDNDAGQGTSLEQVRQHEIAPAMANAASRRPMIDMLIA